MLPWIKVPNNSGFTFRFSQKWKHIDIILSSLLKLQKAKALWCFDVAKRFEVIVTHYYCLAFTPSPQPSALYFSLWNIAVAEEHKHQLTTSFNRNWKWYERGQRRKVIISYFSDYSRLVAYVKIKFCGYTGKLPVSLLLFCNHTAFPCIWKYYCWICGTTRKKQSGWITWESKINGKCDETQRWNSYIYLVLFCSRKYWLVVLHLCLKPILSVQPNWLMYFSGKLEARNVCT